MRLLKSKYIAIYFMSFIVLSLTFILIKNSFSKTHHFSQELSSVGMTYYLTKQNLFIYIDQKKMLQSISKQQKAGFIDQNLSKTEISFYQSLLAASVSLHYVADILKTLYSTQSNLDIIHVFVYLTATNLYGNNEKSLCYSFDFGRQIYQQINWGKFSVDNIRFIAPNFQTYDACRTLTQINPKSF